MAMGYFISKVVGALLSPGALLLVGALVGTMLLWSKRWRRGRAILSLLLMVLVVIVALPVDRWVLRPLEDRFPANPALPQTITGIIVLGGAVDQYMSEARGQIALNDAGERMVAAAALGHLHPEAKLVVTGGAADPARPFPKEAPAMASLLTSLGLDASRIVIEDQSRNTYENAVFSQRLVRPQKGDVWVLITSANHMPRAVGCFRSVGWSVIPYPVDYQIQSEPGWVNEDLAGAHIAHLSKAAHEWAGLLFYRLSGWTENLLPAP